MKSYLLLIGSWLPMCIAIYRSAEPSAHMPLAPGHTRLQPTAQIPGDTVFFDDFSNGLTDGWTAGRSSFQVSEGRPIISPQAVSPVFLTTEINRLSNSVWEAGWQVRGSLSAALYIRLHLASSSPSLLDPHRGYHLQIDGSEDTHLYSLWRQNGNTRTLIFRSVPVANHGTDLQIRVRVVRSADGEWQVLADDNASGIWEPVADQYGNRSVKDVSYPTADYAGFAIHFTPSRRSDVTLDYFLIKRLDSPGDSAPPSDIVPGDILINEVLSNPRAGGVEFVELYNFSEKTIDLQQLYLASVSSNGVSGTPRKVSEASIPMPPYSYKVLTPQPSVLQQYYPNGDAGTFLEVPTMPNFNNNTGGVVVYAGDRMIDSLFYTFNGQSSLLVNPKGISLERQSFSTPTNQRDNFLPAATSVGGATPGYRNSVAPTDASRHGFSLASPTFSPDGDGFEDLLEINYSLPEYGYIARVDIFDDSGQLAKKLLRNESVGTRGQILWDGMCDNGQRAPVGLYIAVVEIYHPNGITKIYRLPLVLAARL